MELARMHTSAHLAILLLTALSLSACSGSKKSDPSLADRSPNSPVEGQRPAPGDKDAEVPAVPDGAPVVVEGIANGANEEPSAMEKGASEVASAKTESAVRDSAAAAKASPSVSRGEVSLLMQKGPAFLLQSVRVKPWRSSGKFGGFEIVAMTPGSQRRVEPHLQVGDVITHLNGVRQRHPNDYMSAWRKLAQVETIKVDIKRDGKPMQARWVIKD